MKSAAPENPQVLDDDALDSAKGGVGLPFPERPPGLTPLPRFPFPVLPPSPTFAPPRPHLPDPPPFRDRPLTVRPILQFE